jgi:hypothetical protein
MVRIRFSDEVVSQLRFERFNHPHPRVQQKMEALLLKSEDLMIKLPKSWVVVPTH